MTNERVVQLVREAYEKNFTELNLSGNQLTQIPPEIGELGNLTELNLSWNQLTQIPPEICELENLTTLNLSQNQLTQIPPEIGKLENLTTLKLSGNQLIQIPPEIKELKSLSELDLSWNQLTQIPPEIKELKNLKTLKLSWNQLTQIPPEIKELKSLKTLVLSGNQRTKLTPEIKELENLTTLNLSWNQLTQVPPEIIELKSLTELALSGNQLTQIPPEIIELKSLTELDLSVSQLTQIPPEIIELKNLTTLYLAENQLTQIPPEIKELKNLTTLYLSGNQLTQIPPEIKELKNLTTLNLSGNQLTQIPPEIKELKNLTELDLSGNQLTQLPLEIVELKSLTTLNLFGNQLTKLPPEIKELKNLTTLNLSGNQLTQIPPEIIELKSLTTLYLSENQLTKLPPEIVELKNLTTLNLSENPLISPTPEIALMGVEAIFTYLKQSKTFEHNEAKLILVGNGEVGKTCLANRLINDVFVEDQITEGIKRSEWSIPAPGSGNSTIKLNIWDFGGQEIYHATHQFFLTTRSVYLLVWNARKTKDYDNIYYWLHTIEAFGEGSPIILVMSKMNENDDDLNLKDLKSKFPQIVDDLKVDSEDGKGISILKEKICETAWSLPLMRTPWVESWYRVRKKLEELRENWITYEEFYKICISEGLDDKNISTLDGNLHELGVILHFKDRIALKNIVILKPEWATGAFYKILSAKSVLQREGLLLHSELDQIWDKETYPPGIYPQLIELMNKFELAYELPDKKSYLVAELLPKNTPDFEWDDEENLYFYYCYDSFLPAGIITRFIVRMHQDIEKKENGMPFCWREGVMLRLQNSRALVEMKPDEKQIEIRIKGENKRGALEVIRYHLNHINTSIKKIKVSKQIPCNCSENCPERYSYEKLLDAEKRNEGPIQCHESFKHIPISLLLDGYSRREERFREYNEISRQLEQPFVFSPNVTASFEANPIIKVEQKTDVNLNIKIDLRTDLPQIQTNFNKLRKEIKSLSPELKSELDEIQDTLDEVNANSEKERLNKPFNKLHRFLDELSDPNSEYSKVITGTQKGIELAQKVGRTYNKFAQWLAIPQVPDLFLGK
ncbi:leucine-rich repeat domain-containing protein [Methanosarcina sp. Mfa9]|uniref:leucine-rich repeat domain-containing protein n=1 Tax=Methanosarcina sp. Mfa9 TaxID=3439063 RepID=UPI003F86E16F